MSMHTQPINSVRDVTQMLCKVESAISRSDFAIISTTVRYKGTYLPLTYTIGLDDCGHPEILTFGLPQSVAYPLVQRCGQLLLEGSLPIDCIVRDLVTLPIMLKSVPPLSGDAYVPLANLHAGREVHILQLIWTDPNGLFPWDYTNHSKHAYPQPTLCKLFTRS